MKTYWVNTSGSINVEAESEEQAYDLADAYAAKLEEPDLPGYGPRLILLECDCVGSWDDALESPAPLAPSLD